MRRRTAQKQNAKKKVPILKWLFYILFIFLIGYLIYYLISVIAIKLDDPTKASGSHQYLFSQLNNDTKKTLVVLESGSGDNEKISEAYLFLTNKNKKDSILIYIPGWLYFAGLEENFGNSIPVSSFKYAGDFLQEGRGVEYAIWQIGQMLGIQVDNYIWLTSKGVSTYSTLYGDINEVQDKLKQYYTAPEGDILSDPFFKMGAMSSNYSFVKNLTNIREMYNLSDQIYSNYTFSQVLSFFANFNENVEDTDTYGIDLSYNVYSTESLSTSGGQVRYIDTGKFDTVYRSLMSNVIDRLLEKERVRVEVYNGSGVSGAAQQFGRKIENSGCDVVRYENAPSVVDRTVVYVPNKNSYSNSLKIVSGILSENYDLVEGRPQFMTTGDIVVVLGQDIKQMYSF